MSLMAKVLLTYALEGERLQLLVAVVFLVFLGVELELRLDLFQFNGRLEIGPLH